MLNANARKNFTACGDAEAEMLLEKVLCEIGETLSSNFSASGSPHDVKFLRSFAFNIGGKSPLAQTSQHYLQH